MQSYVRRFFRSVAFAMIVAIMAFNVAQGAYNISTTLSATSLTLTTPLATSSGGTGSATLSTARTNLGLGTGDAVQFAGITGTTAILSGKLTSYNGVAASTTMTFPLIVASGRQTGQTGALASVAAYTVGGSDGSFEISGNMLATTSTTYDFKLSVDYTDESNTARTSDMAFSGASGVSTGVANWAGPVFPMLPMRIRCKTGTSITVKTTGTFTTVTYNVEADIKQVS